MKWNQPNKGLIWNAEMAKRWERLPPTNMAQVEIPDKASKLYWVEFVVGYRSSPFFLPPQKPGFPNLNVQFDQEFESTRFVSRKTV